MSDEITRVREKFRNYIMVEDITLQTAAERVGWKGGASVYKFLAGKHKPTARRLYRIKKLVGVN